MVDQQLRFEKGDGVDRAHADAHAAKITGSSCEMYHASSLTDQGETHHTGLKKYPFAARGGKLESEPERDEHRRNQADHHAMGEGERRGFAVCHPGNER